MKIRPACLADMPALCALLDEQNVFHAKLSPEFFRTNSTQVPRIRAVLDAQDA